MTTCGRTLRIGWQGSRARWRHGCSTGLLTAAASLPLPVRVPAERRPPVFRESIANVRIGARRCIERARERGEGGCGLISLLDVVGELSNPEEPKGIITETIFQEIQFIGAKI